MIYLLFCVLRFTVTLANVISFFDAEHFDDIRRDTQIEKRPPNIVAFYRSGKCENRLAKLDLPTMRRSKGFPSRSQLNLGVYNIDNQDDKWYNFYPEKMDLPARFNATDR